MVGHSPAAQALETTYFQILCCSSGPIIIVSALSAFFTGRGLTWVTMIVSGIACAVNIAGDYLLVFDKLHLGIEPIAGAAWATVVGHLVSLGCYAVWMYWPQTRVRYGLTTGWKLDWPLMRRLIAYGGSSGIHFLVEGGGFTVLVMMVGRLGEVASMSTTLAFSVNIVAFIPMVGLGIAISTLAGQPDPAEFALIRGTTVVLLRFVAVYFLFDTMQIVFACALKGAGDTLFVLLVAGTASIVSITIGQIGAAYFGGGLYWWWTVMTVWLSALAMAYLARFCHGGWKRMRVIERQYAGQPAEEKSVADLCAAEPTT
jgi:MATE family multidrug resistance protein